MKQSLIQALRSDPRFYHVAPSVLSDIAHVVMLHKLEIKQARLCAVVPDGYWYSKKLGNRIYVIDTGEPILRPLNNPNLMIDRRHVNLKGLKKLPKCFKSLVDL